MSDFDEMYDAPSVSFDFAGFQRMVKEAKAEKPSKPTIVTLATAKLPTGKAVRFNPAWVAEMKQVTIPLAVICAQHIGTEAFNMRYAACVRAVKYAAEGVGDTIAREMGGNETPMMAHLVMAATEFSFNTMMKLLVKSKGSEGPQRDYLASQASHGMIAHFEKLATACQLLTWLADQHDLPYIPYGWDGFTSGAMTLPLEFESLAKTIEMIEAFRFMLHMIAVTSDDEINNDFHEVGDKVAPVFEWDIEMHDTMWFPKLEEAAPVSTLPTMPNFDDFDFSDEEE